MLTRQPLNCDRKLLREGRQQYHHQKDRPVLPPVGQGCCSHKQEADPGLLWVMCVYGMDLTWS